MTTTEAVQGEHGHADQDPVTSDRPGRSWSGVVAVAVPTAITAAHATLYRSWIADDAGITFAYARSLTSGDGLALQPGAAPVEGYSNPLWLAVIALGRLLGLFDRGAWFGVPDLVAFPKLAALACCAGVFACMLAVARPVTARPVLVTVVAGSLTACVPSFVIWSFSGLENALYALLVVALAATLARAVLAGTLATERVATMCGLLAAGAALTRPDGLIYVLAFPAMLAVPHRRALLAAWSDVRRPLARYVVTVALPTLGYLVLRLAVFGDWLPATVRSKSHGLPGLDAVDRPVDLLGQVGWLAALGVVVLVVVALRGPSRLRDALVGVLTVLGLAVVAFAILPPDWMWEARFATPIWPLAALAASLAGACLLAGASRGRRLVAGGVAVVVILVSGSVWVMVSEQFRAAPVAPLCSYARFEPYRLNAVSDALGIRDGSFVGVDAGAVGLASRLRFVDAVGLTDARAAAYWEARDMAGLRDYMFDEVRPTFFMVVAAWDRGPGLDSTKGGPRLRDDPRFVRDYAELIPDDPKARASGARAGIWVRRDALPVDPVAVTVATAAAKRANAAAVADRVRGESGPGGALGWSCPAVLRPA